MREIAHEETAVAGLKRERVLSLVDKLHREGAIPFEQFAAAGIFRDAIMGEAPPSARRLVLRRQRACRRALRQSRQTWPTPHGFHD